MNPTTHPASWLPWLYRKAPISTTANAETGWEATHCIVVDSPNDERRASAPSAKSTAPRPRIHMCTVLAAAAAVDAPNKTVTPGRNRYNGADRSSKALAM